MPGSSACWGIEIGASAIKAMKMESGGDEGVKVLEYAVIQHPKVLSTPGVDANDVLRVSLGALTSQHDLTKATIAVSVPGHAGFARFAKLPPVEAKKVPDIVKFEAMQQVPFPLEQVEWDYQTFVSPDSPEIEVGIFAITKERVAERLQMLADFGINPKYVVLSPLAVYNALAYDLQFGPETPGTIIVDVGTTSTDLVIATPGRMWVRTFPIGGHQFTEALVNQFQLSYPKAEKLKREAEDSKHARQVFQAMRPIFTDLAQDIQRSIGYYQSLNKDANLTRLIGVGSTFSLPGLRKYLKQQLSMDVYRIEEFRRASMEGAKPGDEKSQALNAASLSLCTAYGLGLQALEQNAVSGNLMPVSVLRKSMWKEKVPWFGLAAGVSLLAGGVMFVGPVKDYFAVKGPDGVAPPIIAQAVSAANRNKSEAEAAGVLSSGEPDYRAANMVALLERKGVFRRIAQDVAEMVGEAGRGLPAGATGPAYALKKFTTVYQPPFTDTLDTYSLPSVAEDPLSLARIPRIKCVLEVSTSQKEARRFADATLVKWLGANATRADVPYTLKFVDTPAAVTEASRTADASPGRQPAGGGETVTASPSGGGRGRGIVTTQPVETEPPPMNLDTRRYPVVGDTRVSATEQTQFATEATAMDELNKAAPLTATAVVDPVTGNVTITWWAVFMPATTEGGTP